MTAAAVLTFLPRLVLDGTEWTVERREPHLGRVQLVREDGARERVTFRKPKRCFRGSRALGRGGTVLG